MARRKQEIAFQTELATQEDWDDALSKEGLLVVDVYQGWCGPCIGMVTVFRRIRNSINDDLLTFAVANADTIDSLKNYRGRCEPCFLIYASGTLVGHVAGARAPDLAKMIPKQLAIEHQCLAGEAERIEIPPPRDEEPEPVVFQEEEDSDLEEIEIEKEVTVCLIKPDAVEAGKVDEIIEQLEVSGMEIIKQEVRQLTEEEAKSFYAAHEEEEYFEDLIKFMCSGPSHVLMLSEGTGRNTISKFRDLLGPKKLHQAKEEAPDSLRALYGTSSVANALHGSDDKDNALRELAFFFPDQVIPKQIIRQKKPKIQRTLALIRPDALQEHGEEILDKIKEAGFEIAFQKQVQITREQAEEFYKEHVDQDYFEELTFRMSSGPLLALALARVDAIEGWRQMLGPKEIPKAKEEAPESLRAQFSVDETINAVHGSESPEAAEKELEYFFPMEQTLAMVKPDAYQTKDEIIKRIHEAGFRIAARKETQVTKEIAEQLYEDNKDKEYFDQLTEHVSSGQTLFLVLCREDAVDGWRSLIGPPDPAIAKEEAPNTIRAELGVDVTENAVHGSVDQEHAQKELKLIFGDVEFKEDGSIKSANSTTAIAEDIVVEEEKLNEDTKTQEDNETEIKEELQDETSDQNTANEQDIKEEIETAGEESAETETQKVETQNSPLPAEVEEDSKRLAESPAEIQEDIFNETPEMPDDSETIEKINDEVTAEDNADENKPPIETVDEQTVETDLAQEITDPAVQEEQGDKTEE